jgi:hypothetical protein
MGLVVSRQLELWGAGEPVKLENTNKANINSVAHTLEYRVKLLFTIVPPPSSVIPAVEEEAFKQV